MASTTVAATPVPPNALERVMQGLAPGLPPGVSFEFQLPNRPVLRVGTGEVKFRVTAQNESGVRALKSLDELRIGEAYLFGDIDIEGDLVAALDLRNGLKDRRLLAYLWSTFGQRLVYGQTRSDRKWIHEHYDAEADFYLAFLDRETRCYSHGYFEDESESLESATQRKLLTAMEAPGIRPGMRVLDIGAGWGAFTEFAGKRGAHVTSLTISAESEKYVGELIARENLPCRVLREHFLEYKSDEPYDAIVNLGVTEHLPDYEASVAQYQKLLKPGARVYLDACASRTKYPFSTFILKYIWPGNATPLHLASYLDALSQTPLELAMVQNDRPSYLLTTKHWATRLDANRDMLVARWGETIYRRFRLYLWGCVQCFATDTVTAYRWMLEKPQSGRAHTPLSRLTPAKMARRFRRAFGV